MKRNHHTKHKQTIYLIILLILLCLAGCKPIEYPPDYTPQAETAQAVTTEVAIEATPTPIRVTETIKELPPRPDPTLLEPEQFVDVTDSVGISAIHRGSWDEYHKFREFTDGYLAMGQAWGDYNNDGWVDLFVTGGLVESSLYQNNGDGTFTESPLSSDVALPETWSGGAVWADYDNDGWKDLYVLAHGANVLFHNEAGNGFVDVTDIAGVGDTGKSGTASWGDYDKDGYLDLYVANWSCYPKCDPVDDTQARDLLYHNNGDGTFSDVTDLLIEEKTLGAGFVASFMDYDNDGDLDLYVINDKLYNPIGNVLWRNDGEGCEEVDADDADGHSWCWTDVSAEAGADTELHGMGLAVGDYDNDLDLDFYYTNMVDPGMLLQNQGDGTFGNRTAATQLPTIATDMVGWGTAFFDYDNDGWLDLYASATAFILFNMLEGPLGMLFEYPNFLFHNEGASNPNNVTFSDQTPFSWLDYPQPNMGMAYADYDQDGLVDFVTGDWNIDYRLQRNTGLVGHGNNWLTIRLTGSKQGGPVNRDAIGARVYLADSDGKTMMQEVKSGSSMGAGNDTALHFGLGDGAATHARVVWPDGLEEEYTEIPRNIVWDLAYPTQVAQPAQEEDLQEKDLSGLYGDELFVDVSETAGITARHRGSWRMFKYNFDSGYLGVGQAWGDYDNDGWLDLYVTGNLTDSVLYHNEGDGTFTVSPLSEAVKLHGVLTGGAVWADYDNDGWKDLYVSVHGANVLFHNDEGQGFTDVTEIAGVGDEGKGTTATWGDYDNDGWLDLYATTWSCHPECDPDVDHTQADDRLYHNNGDGTFEDVTDLLVFSRLLGAGFTSTFVDYDDDGDMDIYVINDELQNPIGNILWRNDGPGCEDIRVHKDSSHTWCWTDISEESGADIQLGGMGIAIGDYDNDLDLDMYFSNLVNPHVLLQNQGDGTFGKRAKTAGVDIGPSAAVGWGTVFIDYNNDGWLDLYLSTTEFRNHDRETPPDGMHFPHKNFLFENTQTVEEDRRGNRSIAFEDVSPPSWAENTTRSMGIAYADYDQDGWVDMIVSDWNQRYVLHRNQGATQVANSDEHNWISLRLTGSTQPGGPVNRDAVGARAYVTTSDGRVLLQEVKNGSSLGAGNDTALHFGLGAATVDEVRIVWPDGTERILGRLGVNQIVAVGYDDQ
ncbi:MAG: FG-GAP-like repeat-containing protein [Chloroflexota bacterium]